MRVASPSPRVAFNRVVTALIVMVNIEVFGCRPTAPHAWGLLPHTLLQANASSAPHFLSPTPTQQQQLTPATRTVQCADACAVARRRKVVKEHVRELVLVLAYEGRALRTLYIQSIAIESTRQSASVSPAHPADSESSSQAVAPRRPRGSCAYPPPSWPAWHLWQAGGAGGARTRRPVPRGSGSRCART